MAIEDFFVTPMMIVTPGTTTDRYNNEMPDWDNASTVDTNGWLQDLSSVETLGSRDTVTTSARAFLPTDVEIAPTDRVVIDGATYEVDGAPITARTREGPHHLEVTLKLVEDTRVA
jgi:hypothetical protein